MTTPDPVGAEFGWPDVDAYCPVCQGRTSIRVVQEDEFTVRYECPRHPAAAHRVVSSTPVILPLKEAL